MNTRHLNKKAPGATLSALVLMSGILVPATHAQDTGFVPVPVEAAPTQTAPTETAPTETTPAPTETTPTASSTAAPSTAPAAPATPTASTPPDPAQGQALLKAVRAGNAADVQATLQSGGDVNARDAEGKTPLMWAAGLGRTDLVNTLLEKGADVNAQDKFGRTAMSYVLAAAPNTAPPKKKKKGFGGLLGKVGGAVAGNLAGDLLGGNIGNQLQSQLAGGLLNNGLGQSLLGGNLSGLLSGGSFDLGGQSGWSAILGSALMGDNAANGAFGLQSLLSGDLTKLDAGGWTNLISATGKNNPAVLDAMSKLGPGVGAAQSKDWSQFLNLAAQGNTRGVEKLLQGGNVGSLLQQALPGLQAAANSLPGRDGGVGIAQALLAKGANPALADAQGTTALKWAQQRGLSQVADLLQKAAQPTPAPNN